MQITRIKIVQANIDLIRSFRRLTSLVHALGKLPKRHSLPAVPIEQRKLRQLRIHPKPLEAQILLNHLVHAARPLNVFSNCPTTPKISSNDGGCPKIIVSSIAS
jgi:hypothetical protein